MIIGDVAAAADVLNDVIAIHVHGRQTSKPWGGARRGAADVNGNQVVEDIGGGR